MNKICREINNATRGDSDLTAGRFSLSFNTDSHSSLFNTAIKHKLEIESGKEQVAWTTLSLIQALTRSKSVVSDSPRYDFLLKNKHFIKLNTLFLVGLKKPISVNIDFERLITGAFGSYLRNKL